MPVFHGQTHAAKAEVAVDLRKKRILNHLLFLLLLSQSNALQPICHIRAGALRVVLRLAAANGQTLQYGDSGKTAFQILLRAGLTAAFMRVEGDHVFSGKVVVLQKWSTYARHTGPPDGVADEDRVILLPFFYIADVSGRTSSFFSCVMGSTLS